MCLQKSMSIKNDFDTIEFLNPSIDFHNEDTINKTKYIHQMI